MRRPLEAIIVIQVPLISGQLGVRADAAPAAKDMLARAEPSRAAETASVAAAPGPASRGPFIEGSGDCIERDESQLCAIGVPRCVADGELSDGDWELIAGRLRSTSLSPDLVGALVLPDSEAR